MEISAFSWSPKVHSEIWKVEGTRPQGVRVGPSVTIDPHLRLLADLVHRAAVARALRKYEAVAVLYYYYDYIYICCRSGV